MVSSGYGFQSGLSGQSSSGEEVLNDDSYAASMYYDPLHSLLYFTGSTYSTYFDNESSTTSTAEATEDETHLESSDCFLGILKLPTSGNVVVGSSLAEMDEAALTSASLGSKKQQQQTTTPELIYKRRFGTPHNSETCSSILMLPKVHDALIRNNSQLKLVLIGHVNPTPISSAEMKKSMGPDVEYAQFSTDMGDNNRYLRGEAEGKERELQSPAEESSNVNRGGFLHSISSNPPITQEGRAYGFVVDFDISISPQETPRLPAESTTEEISSSGGDIYGALLGGYVLESSPLVYPTAIAQNKRDPNQLYVVSMHSDNHNNAELNPEYKSDVALELIDGKLRERSDMTLGGAGHGRQGFEGGVPKYGTDFYVRVQQLHITPYEELMNVEPTLDEKVKQTMESGWGFGFKLNDANDVRPSTIVFVKGRTVDEDILLLGGTTKKTNDNGDEELDGFITKIVPPAPSPVEDTTTGTTVENAQMNNVQDENSRPTKRIDSTSGRDETVTAICLPPPDRSGLITYAYVVGSTSWTNNPDHDPSLAYILKMSLHDMSIVWKQRVPSVHPSGLGGDVLGEGCAVSSDGSKVYLSGTIDGGSALDMRIMPNGDRKIIPAGGKSDVFVVAFDTDFGTVHWAKQLGTVYEDKLARGGGVECDNDDNVIIMGSSRGGLQRLRPDRVVANVRMASDVFVMSLSKEDGAYINAPYTGLGIGNPSIGATGGISASSAVDTPSAEAAATSEHNSDGKGDGILPSLATIGLSFMVIGMVAMAVFVLGRRRSKRRYKEKHNLWADNGGDDFSYNNKSLGGRRDSTRRRDDWDDGNATINRKVKLMEMLPGSKRGSGSPRSDDDNNSVASMGSTSSGGSASSKKLEENSDFLASLRKEANAAMNKMISKDNTPLESPGANDIQAPCLDGGASIKSLLTQYRETKKLQALEDEGKNDDASPPGSKRKNPPPPPPPRRQNSDQEVDGLSEFTII